MGWWHTRDPREWAHGDCREIQAPRRPVRAHRLQSPGRQLAGFDDFARLLEALRHGVVATLVEPENGQDAG